MKRTKTRVVLEFFVGFAIGYLLIGAAVGYVGLILFGEAS